MDYTVEVDVSCSNEYAEAPAKASITLTTKLIHRIKRLQKAVKDLKVYTIREFDYTPKYKDYDGNESEARIDSCLLEVDDKSFKWVAYLKHSGDEVATGTIWLKDLRPISCKPDQLPKYLVSKSNEFHRTLAEQRLKGV
jgi:hypothetical protein